MNVLILGSGGREHAFAWKIAQSKRLTSLFIAPGNAGTAACGTNVDIAVTDFDKIKAFVWEQNIDLVLVGPEEPLVKGIRDFFSSDEVLKDVAVIGPDKFGAQLEGSKDFSKRFMVRHGIPTAKHATFSKDTVEEAVAFLSSLQSPFVLKADGLAAGKGVLILDEADEAKRSIREMLTGGKFGSAGEMVVIEEFLAGIELSVFVLTDGISYKVLPEAKDYKRIGENDSGPNTGGMGAVSPVPFADRAFMEKVESRIIVPTIKGLNKEGIKYQGFIFIGLMNCKGDPYVIEYNCRMGDPETEAVIPRIKSDLLDLLDGVAKQELHSKELEISKESAATVVLVSGGYPGDYQKGKKVKGLLHHNKSLVFHSGTKQAGAEVQTNGGRVFAITSLSQGIREAVDHSLETATQIDFEGKYYRRDIGRDLLL
jgi:phosphoribosylamine--glycine ligase